MFPSGAVPLRQDVVCARTTRACDDHLIATSDCWSAFCASSPRVSWSVGTLSCRMLDSGHVNESTIHNQETTARSARNFAIAPHSHTRLSLVFLVLHIVYFLIIPLFLFNDCYRNETHVIFTSLCLCVN